MLATATYLFWQKSSLCCRVYLFGENFLTEKVVGTVYLLDLPTSIIVRISMHRKICDVGTV